jgi:hypothetical protein
LYHLDEPGIQRLINPFLEKCDVRIVFYIRLRSDKLRSGLAQNLKFSNKEHGEKACEILLGHMIPQAQPNFDYYAIVRRWQKALENNGWKNSFDLRVYEKKSLLAGDLIKDFFGRIGVINIDESLDRAPFKKMDDIINPSISPVAQYVMALSYLLGLDNKQRRMVRDVVYKYDNPDESKDSVVPDDVAFYWDNNYIKDDQILAKEFFERDALFLEGPKFKYRLPSGDSFIKIFEAVYSELRAMRISLKPALHDAGQNIIALSIGPQNYLRHMILEAELTLEAGDHQTSLGICRNILKKHPDHVKANYLMAMILLELGNPSIGIEHLRLAINNAKNSPVWLEDLRVRYLSHGYA